MVKSRCIRLIVPFAIKTSYMRSFFLDMKQNTQKKGDLPYKIVIKIDEI